MKIRESFIYNFENCDNITPAKKLLYSFLELKYTYTRIKTQFEPHAE